jgi:hypothetical protein
MFGKGKKVCCCLVLLVALSSSASRFNVVTALGDDVIAREARLPCITTQLFGRILQLNTLVFLFEQESQSFRAYPFYPRQCQRVISRSHPGTEGTDIMGIFSNRWAGYDLNDTLTNLIIKPLISMMRTVLCGFIQIHGLF